MGTWGITHWLILIVWVVVFIVPCWRIVQKAGFSGAWSLIAFVPLLNLIFFWIFAFMKWPNERSSGQS